MGSLKALFESFQAIHEEQLPNDLDMALVTKLITMLLQNDHYVVLMFTLRWLYECLDVFRPAQRAQLMGVACGPATLC